VEEMERQAEAAMKCKKDALKVKKKNEAKANKEHKKGKKKKKEANAATEPGQAATEPATKKKKKAATATEADQAATKHAKKKKKKKGARTAPETDHEVVRPAKKKKTRRVANKGAGAETPPEEIENELVYNEVQIHCDDEREIYRYYLSWEQDGWKQRNGWNIKYKNDKATSLSQVKAGIDWRLSEGWVP
jgi:hypothetical protein